MMGCLLKGTPGDSLAKLVKKELMQSNRLTQTTSLFLSQTSFYIGH